MPWQKQTDEPLFPDILWGRPENRQAAGKILIIGGQAGEFSLVGGAFELATKAGAGTIRVLLPESLKQAAQMIPEVEFAPSNKSGSFAKSSLAVWFDEASWADQVFLAGDFGNNSETTTILDGFLLRSSSNITITQNVLDSTGIPLEQLSNLPLTLVADQAFLQKLVIELRLETPVNSTTPVHKLAEIIQEVSKNRKTNFIIQGEEQIWVAVDGNVVSTNAKNVQNTKLAAFASVFLAQNPKKRSETISTAVYEALRT